MKAYKLIYGKHRIVKDNIHNPDNSHTYVIHLEDLCNALNYIGVKASKELNRGYHPIQRGDILYIEDGKSSHSFII